MQIVWRYPLRMLLVLAMCLWFGVSYVELNNKNEIYHFYEEHSHMPIMQLFHNRHFAKSRQFQDFLDVVEETEYRNKDYAQIVLTDCEHVTGTCIYIQGNLLTAAKIWRGPKIIGWLLDSTHPTNSLTLEERWCKTHLKANSSTIPLTCILSMNFKSSFLRWSPISTRKSITSMNSKSISHQNTLQS